MSRIFFSKSLIQIEYDNFLVEKNFLYDNKLLTTKIGPKSKKLLIFF